MVLKSPEAAIALEPNDVEPKLANLLASNRKLKRLKRF